MSKKPKQIKEEDTRYCFECHKVKPLSEFNDTKVPHLLKMKSLKGKRYRCIKCE